MSDDEETLVRQRLHRLLGGRARDMPVSGPAAVPPAPPANGGLRSAADHPPAPPHPGPLEPEARPLSMPGRSLRRDASAEPTDRDRRATGRGVSPDPPLGAADDGAPPVPRLPGPGAFDPGRRGVRALAVVAVLVVLGAGLWAWQSRPRAEPVRAVADQSAPLAVDGSAAPAGPEPAASGELVVAVAGRVRRPGLVRVPAGARVADAVEAAGGVLPGVDLALLNPARKVTDGELILVGVTPPPNAPGQPAAGAPPGATAPDGKVNLNTATLAQLDALPGVGPVLAQRILTHRDQHGGFRSVGDLRQVEGIGDARYEQLKELVTV